jgi:hypothetical protein
LANEKRCVKCVLPENYPGIAFSAEGVCHYCEKHRKLRYRGEEALERFLDPFMRSDAKYNCLVPLSGGKDSTYVLHQMKTRFGMRPLAFNYDNSLTDPQARENVRSVAEGLGVEVISLRNEKQRHYLRTNLRAMKKLEKASMVTMLCNGCRYGIIGNAFKIAAKRKIPLVLIGWSPIEDTPFKEALLRQDGGSVMKGVLANLVRNPSYARPSNLVAAAKDYFHNYSHIKENQSKLLHFLYPKVQLVQFYDYVPYDPAKIKRTLEREIGWRSPDAGDSWQFDCKIKLLQSYYYDKTLGFTSFVDYLSALVREGQITRQNALEQLEKAGARSKSKLEQIHKLLEELELPELIVDFKE